jgi:uncharacterized membrane protein
MTDRARRVQRLAIGAWILLTASVACWPLTRTSGIGVVTSVIALVPLLLPIAGILRGSQRAWRIAALTLAPVLALAVTEFLVNAPSRPWAGTTLALIVLAFAGLVAALKN